MAREIELKIPLTEQQYEKIKHLLYSEESSVFTFSEVSFLKKSDDYYSRFKTHQERMQNSEPEVIRIRTEISENFQKTFLTIKDKKNLNGIECNQESETFVENPDVIRNLFERTGFIKWFHKNKEAFSVHCRYRKDGFLSPEYHLELERVNNMPYLEIEYTGDEYDYDFIKNHLEKLAVLLGADIQKKDSRSWVEIIKESSQTD